MSSSAYSGNPDASPTGLAPAPPPPPPPPPALGQVPTLRINTSDVRSPALRRTPNNNDPYEPPAAIQNAMMTKDKKPFTYTPGMGGKLDLSQIRSPRMARRVAKNANDEGIEGPPKSALESKPLPPSPLAGGHSFAQPQVAVPVFPGSLPLPGQTSINRTPSAHVTRVPSNVSDGQTDAARSVVRNETKVAPATIIPNLPPATPQSPTSPPIVTLAKAPTPWLQNKTKPQEDLPEWAKRTPGNRGHNDAAGDNGPPPQIYYQQQQQPAPQTFSQPPRPHTIQQVANNQPRQQDRVIPIRIEDRPSVFAVKNEPGHHQFKQPPNHQQRWGQEQTQQQQQYQSQPQYQNENQPQSLGGGRIIPIMVEDNNGHPQTRTIPIEVQGSRVIVQRGPGGPGGVAISTNQPEPGPVQSRAFRVLQKITDTDSDPDVDGNSEQIRKLQLTEDDKMLMNKFKEQAPRHASAIHKKQNRNSNTFEEAQANLPPSEQQVQEPKKYMGSAIPSRSFRILQAMTSPEDIAPQENRQQDITSRTENSVQGNQQSGVFFPNCPPTYWSPDNGWWGFYPFQYPATTPSQNTTNPSSSNNMQAYNPYAYCGYGSGNSFAAYYPIYDHQNYHQNYDPSISETESGSYDYHNYPFYPMDPNHPTECVSEEVASSPSETKKPESDEPRPKNLAIPPREERKKSNFLTVPKWTNPSRSSGSKNSEDTANGRGEDPGETEMRGQSHTDDDVSSVSTAKSEESDSDSDSDSDSSAESSEDSSTSDEEEEEAEEDDEDTESESGSEYQAYTTNFGEKREEPRSECPQSLSATTISEDAYEHSSRLSSDKLSCSDCDSDADDEYQIESLNNDNVLPHQLSVIYEDSEQTETETEGRKLEALARKGEGETSFKDDNDEPPDDNDDATVSVSLPLRFKFSVSENNEDVTTVVVGDSTMKSTRRSATDETTSRTFNEDANNEVRVNIQINTDNETSVDFTLKKHRSSEECNFDTEFTLTKEETSVGTRERGTRSVDAEVTLKPGEMDYNANLTDPTRFVVDGGEARSLDCNDNVETEFTIVRRKTDVTKHVWRKDLDLSRGLDGGDAAEEEVEETSNVTEFSVKSAESGVQRVFDADFEVTESKSEVENNVRRDIVERKSLRVKERGSSETEFAVKKIQKKQKKQQETEEQREEAEQESKMGKVEVEKEGEGKNEGKNEEKNEGGKNEGKNEGLPFEYTARSEENKRLLSVQNSRDETDDEDSGVTSDMSRLISEVDTDSECASTRRGSKYQRTQTHSRLFKLLNDDSILTEDSETESPPPRGGCRDHLSLPLKSSVFNYDENYYSNYSSGITSPDYSPICEQSWRRIHEGSRPFEGAATPSSDACPYLNDSSPSFLAALNEKQLTDDEYFQTWKKAASPTSFHYDVVPSIVFKKLQENNNLYETTMPAPLRTKQRVHVLCPRIKSSKNVPQVLLSGDANRKRCPATPTPCSVAKPPTPIPFRTKISSLKNGHC